MGQLEQLAAFFKTDSRSQIIPALPAVPLAGEEPATTSERGFRTTVENQTKYLYRQMWVDPDLRQAILDIRDADRGLSTALKPD